MTDPALRSPFRNGPARDAVQRAWRTVARWRWERVAVPVVVAALAVTTTSLVSGSPSLGGVPVDVAPAVADELQLPRLETALPSDVRGDPGPSLSGAPVARALAVVQSHGLGGALLVLDEDGRLRRLDTARVQPPTDADGNRQAELDTTSLSPDGTHAAFAQPDEVVVVDLTTARTSSFPVAGYNENVVWRRDGDGLVVQQEGHSFLLDVRTGAVQRQPSGERATDMPLPAIAHENRFSAGWHNGDEVALTTSSSDGEMVVVADSVTGTARRALRIDFAQIGSGPHGVIHDRAMGCCPVLGWLGPDTVLLQSSSRVLGWDTVRGDVSLIADLPAEVTGIALPDLSR